MSSYYWKRTAIFSLLLNITFLFLFYYSSISNTNKRNTQQKTYQEELNRLKKNMTKANYQLQTGLTQEDLILLKRQGLKDPENEIVASLQNQKGLVPEKAALGGNFSFYDKTQIYIVNQKWVYAYFEDGHNAGYALLEFNISSKSTFQWKILAWYLI